jgi:ATP-binding cassette subfamily B protein
MNYVIQQLWPWFKKYRWYLIAGVCLILVSNSLAIYPAQIVRQAFDLVDLMLNSDKRLSGFEVSKHLRDLFWKVLLGYGLLVFAFAVVRGIFLYFMRQTLIVMSRYIEYEQKNQLYQHYQTYSMRLLRKQRTGDLMARLSEDLSNVRMFTGPGIMYSLNTLSLFVMLLIIMLSVNVELTLYVMIPVPLLTLLLYYVHSIIIEKSDAAQRQLSMLTSFLQEAFSGIRLLKSYGRETAWGGRYANESEHYRTRALVLARIDSLFYPTVMLLIGLSILFIIWIGGYQVIQGCMTVGNIAEFILYVNLLIWPVAALGWVTSLIQKAVASQRRIDYMLNLNSEIHFPKIGKSPNGYSLELQDVSLTYSDTGIRALVNVSMKIDEGSFVGIVGATGSGKSTLVQVLARFMDPDLGTVKLGGCNLSDIDRQMLYRTISLVPQDIFLFSDTIRNNIAFGQDHASEEDIIEAIAFAGLSEDLRAFPNGLDTELGERGVTLSGGQKQRLCIARAYLTRSPVLILDDSLSAVDLRTEEEILMRLTQSTNSKGQTLILVTHRLSSLLTADRIWVLEEGKLVESGTYSSLIAQDGHFAQMHQRQELEAQIQLMN